jgi:hypothetical protein
MISVVTLFGSVIMATIGFIFGRLYAESERILAEKRKVYLEFLSALPPLQDMCLDRTKEEYSAAMRPAIERLPSLLFYADKSVLIACGILQQNYDEAHTQLTTESPALDPAYKDLSRAQNDLVLEMRRDAFRWSLFNYSGKTRTPDNLESPNK